MISVSAEYFHTHKDAIQAIASIISALCALVALLGIWIAAAQIRDSRNQRELAESLDLSSKLDASLRAWKSCVDSQSGDLGICVGHTLSLYEIISGSLNRRLFTANTRPLLRSHIKDGLGVLCSSKSTRLMIEKLLSSKHVCISTRVFLLRNVRFLKRSSRYQKVYQAFFSNFNTEILLSNSPRGVFTRFMVGAYVRVTGEIP